MGLGISEMVGQPLVSSVIGLGNSKSPETEGVPVEGSAVEGARRRVRIGSIPGNGCSGPITVSFHLFVDCSEGY
jgi:hypothetical protein